MPGSRLEENNMWQDVKRCARCGGDHKNLMFTRFVRYPPEPWTHWATCPVMGAPILLLSEETSEQANDGNEEEN